MAEYVVKVADERGRVLEQVESGYSVSDVRDRFAQQGLLVYSIKPRGLLSADFRRSRRRKVKLEPFVMFNAQFLTLIRAGLPILTALELLIKRQRHVFLRSLLENVRDRVKGGESLSQAFAAQEVFPKLYTTTLLAGEKSGALDEVLNRYVSFQRLALSFRKKLRASLIYPALLVVLVTIMLTFLLTWVVPQFGELYAQISTNAQLPALTVFMLSVGNIARRYGLVVAAALAITIFLLWRYKESDGGARRIDHFRLRLPVLGPIWLKYQVTVFARMLGTLLSGGLPLLPALETAGGSMQSRSIADSVLSAAQRVREGQPLARSLEQDSKFPDLAVEMIEVGESTGALPAMLASVADFYEEDVQTALASAMSLIEPAILIFMGVIVGFVLLSLYLPIFSLGAGIR